MHDGSWMGIAISYFKIYCGQKKHEVEVCYHIQLGWISQFLVFNNAKRLNNACASLFNRLPSLFLNDTVPFHTSPCGLTSSFLTETVNLQDTEQEVRRPPNRKIHPQPRPSPAREPAFLWFHTSFIAYTGPFMKSDVTKIQDGHPGTTEHGLHSHQGVSHRFIDHWQTSNWRCPLPNRSVKKYSDCLR